MRVFLFCHEVLFCHNVTRQESSKFVAVIMSDSEQVSLYYNYIARIPVDVHAVCQDSPDFPPADLPSPSHVECLAQSFLLHHLRVLGSVRRAGCRFLRVLGFA